MTRHTPSADSRPLPSMARQLSGLVGAAVLVAGSAIAVSPSPTAPGSVQHIEQCVAHVIIIADEDDCSLG